MYYILFYETVPNYLEARQPHRANHFEHLEAAKAAGILVMAGAFANPADGAALVFTGETEAVAKDFARTDPYVLNGLINRWYVREWTVVID